MSATKHYHYVLVITDSGPVFVTSTEYHRAFWDKNAKPRVFTASMADDVYRGLCLNGFSAYHVVSAFELSCQPYRYDTFDIEFKEREDR